MVGIILHLLLIYFVTRLNNMYLKIGIRAKNKHRNSLLQSTFYF